MKIGCFQVLGTIWSFWDIHLQLYSLICVFSKWFCFHLWANKSGSIEACSFLNGTSHNVMLAWSNMKSRHTKKEMVQMTYFLQVVMWFYLKR